MRIFYRKIYTILLTLVFFSCSNKERKNNYESFYSKNISFDFSEISSNALNLSEIAFKIEYIPLETTESNLLKPPNDFVVTKDWIFIKNEFEIYKFDKNGRFRGSLFKVGRGPAEAFSRYFAIDETKNLVNIFDQNLKNIKIYDYNGTLIRIIDRPIKPENYWVTSIGIFSKYLLISTDQRPGVNYLYSLYDLEDDSIHILYNNNHHYKETQYKQRPQIIFPYDYNYQIMDSCILIKETFCDTIYGVNSKDFVLDARYIINLGNRKLNWETWRDHSMFNIAGGPPSNYWIQSFVETRNFLLMVLKSFKENQLLVCYNKLSGNIRITKRDTCSSINDPVYFNNDIDKLVPFPPMNRYGYFFYFDNSLYSLIEAKDFIEAYQSASDKTKTSTKHLQNMTKEFNRINEFSNPVLMKVYLK